MLQAIDEQTRKECLAEYESLRTEILKRQAAREVVLKLTVGALAAILGILLHYDQPGAAGSYSASAALLLGLSFVLILGAVLFTTHHTQQIDVISGFIRSFIEPKLPGISWESRWTKLRSAIKAGSLKSTLPMGTSKFFARYYLLLTLGIYGLSIMFQVLTNLWAGAILTALFLACLVAEHDLFARWSKGWQVNWKELVGQSCSGTAEDSAAAK
jgi:hypothetical protein